ncbi:hypothetical protein K402DRAFT_417091 [Aulographum hederae CBS 113979]|uniref:Beta/gamma crystallin 'Greek key' domain-containing protein n=1 Tax=Aulographum hederae CBS 113979 TaxID=1176131 RepID=A0A6G1HDB2_9PEZI|nr:hypothetical protein K402DRAFT_417091 [Aulographum hederae CBS 113979]
MLIQPLLLLSAILGTTTATALPKSPPIIVDAATINRTVATNANPGLFFCADPGFKGECLWIEINSPGLCYLLPASWYNRMSAVGPDPGLACDLFRGKNDCTDQIFKDLKNPGTPDLRRFPPSDDAVNSFRCRRI